MIRKHAFLHTGLILLAAALAVGPASWVAAENLPLSGAMPSITTVVIAADAQATALDIATAGAHNDVQVGVATETNNDVDGYTLQLKSLNAEAESVAQASLLRTGGGRLNYSITYNGLSVTLDGTGKAIVTDSLSTTPVAGLAKNIQITYTGRADSVTGNLLTAGTYTDTLVLTIAAK